MGEPWCLGFDVGGTRLKAAAVGRDPRVLCSDAVRVDGLDFTDVLARMDDLAERYVERLGGPPVGIGIAMPGLVRASTGAVVLPGRTAGIEGFPLAERLRSRFGVPVVCLNDGTAAAIGEWRAGAGQGHASIASITIGTGIGGGAIVHGTPVGDLERGLGSYLGHLSLERDGDACVCGNTGCAETLLSANAIVGRVRAALGRAVPSSLAGTPADALSFERIVAAAAHGDPLCGSIIDRFTHDLGRFLVSIAHALAPEVIVISGGAAPACVDLLDGVRGSVTDHVFALDGMSPRIELSSLGDLAGVHGACAEAWRRADLAFGVLDQPG